MRRTAKCTWQDYRTNEDILSELKINPLVKKIQTYRNMWIQFLAKEQRKTISFNNEISTMWETKPRTVPQKT
jgi:hypothetical protein